MNQPVIVRLFVVLPAVFDRVSKFCVDAEASVVRLTHCPAAGRAVIARSVKARAVRWWGPILRAGLFIRFFLEE
jgi:hypothetical protein